MKKAGFALAIIFLVISCKKTETTTMITPIVVQEETIKFTTNLDTGIYNVADTLPLVISVSSKIPTTGILFSITTSWTDSAKQIFKLDTSLTTSNLSLNIPGLKVAGNYSIGIILTSKSTNSNTSKFPVVAGISLLTVQKYVESVYVIVPLTISTGAFGMLVLIL